jgi:pimeloyl-ACP methyl ester carboxylesterase
MTMLVDLMSATTSDNVRLDGAFFAPKPGVARRGPVEALLVLHGSRGNFYNPGNLAMAEELRNHGYPCLSLNTAAHDNVWVNPDGRYFGNAFDILDRCRLDIRAGVDYLAGLGYGSVGLLGFSMGAVRVAYYAATEADHRVATVIPVSPVRLSYSYYMASKDAAEFQGIVQRADRLEAEDKAQELMAVKFPIAQMFSAASYLDKHGPAERYNLVTLAPRIKLPIFVLGGSLETHTRLQDMARDLGVAVVNSAKASHLVVEGGNHSLNNRRKEAVTAVLGWLASLTPAPVGV